ncbi:hypothetical protein [Sphingopyxis sp. H038]|uniref:hypothetical protein n=2 Tax=Sphingopyxis TaxID=165697 RepID=UPI0018D20868|nr:hypothetical protein [Sphingopyxis sp. H038]
MAKMPVMKVTLIRTSPSRWKIVIEAPARPEKPDGIDKSRRPGEAECHSSKASIVPDHGVFDSIAVPAMSLRHCSARAAITLSVRG